MTGLPTGSSLALLTDLYQLTMAYGYWKQQKANHLAVFHLFFRNSPFGGGYALAAGLEPVSTTSSDFGSALMIASIFRNCVATMASPSLTLRFWSI